MSNAFDLKTTFSTGACVQKPDSRKLFNDSITPSYIYAVSYQLCGIKHRHFLHACITASVISLVEALPPISRVRAPFDNAVSPEDLNFSAVLG